MADAYVVQVGGHTAGILVRDYAADTFSFFAATHEFNALEGKQFIEPHAAERAAYELTAPHGTALQSEIKTNAANAAWLHRSISVPTFDQ